MIRAFPAMRAAWMRLRVAWHEYRLAAAYHASAYHRRKLLDLRAQPQPESPNA